MEPAKPESAATTVEQAAEAVADKHDNEQQYEGYSRGIDVTAKKFKCRVAAPIATTAARYSPAL